MKNILITLAILISTQAQACIDEYGVVEPVAVESIKHDNNNANNPIFSVTKNDIDGCWTPLYLKDKFEILELPHSKLEIDIDDENICDLGYIHPYEVNLFYKKYKKNEDVTFLHKNNEITVLKSNDCIEKVIIKPKVKKYNIITNKKECKDIDKYVFIENDFNIEFNGKKLEKLTDESYFFNFDFLGWRTVEALALKYFLYSLFVIFASMLTTFGVIKFITIKILKE